MSLIFLYNEGIRKTMAMDPASDTANAPLFVENQWSPAWVFILLAPACVLALVVGIAGLVHDRNPWLFLPLCAVLLTVNLLHVKTRVDARFLTVTFGFLFPLYRRRIRLLEIRSAEAVTYNPTGEYGGWGIRGFKGDQCLSARGNAGVRLTMANGDKLLVGSGKADDLARILRPLS